MASISSEIKVGMELRPCIVEYGAVTCRIEKRALFHTWEHGENEVLGIVEHLDGSIEKTKAESIKFEDEEAKRIWTNILKTK